MADEEGMETEEPMLEWDSKQRTGLSLVEDGRDLRTRLNADEREHLLTAQLHTRKHSGIHYSRRLVHKTFKNYIWKLLY